MALSSVVCERYSSSKNVVTLKPGLGVTQGHRNRHISSPPPMISY